MKNIRSKILNSYGIDIDQENIFKLYKIDSVDITPSDLSAKIEAARKRWNTSINGANEKNAERDRARLEKADKYEAILSNPDLRRELFNYYQGSNSKSSNKSGGDNGNGSTSFAKKYFKLVSTTKKVRKDDVDFFFEYFQSERKNKKAILEMLSKELKILGLGKESSYSDEKEEDEEDKKKNKPTHLITNLFSKTTVLKIQRAVEKYEEASKNNELCQRYPKLREGFYEFLEIDSISNAEQFTELMSQRSKEVYDIRQDKGVQYVPLVDLFNNLKSMGEYKDVIDNIDEFKLLLKYPNLTPYMFSFVEMKPSTVKGMVEIANNDSDYDFRDEVDFVLNYYQPLYDNFGISNNSIGSIIKKAKKQAAKNKVLNKIDKINIPIMNKIIHWLVYWPIFAAYLVFEAAKVIVTQLDRFNMPIFIALFVLENFISPRFGIDNLAVLLKLFFKEQWLSYLNEFVGSNVTNGFLIVWVSLLAIIFLLAIYIIPPLVIVTFLSDFVQDFNKNFDWVGIERTFKQIFTNINAKSNEQYRILKKKYFKSKLPNIIINLACLAVLIIIVRLVPILLELAYKKCL